MLRLRGVVGGFLKILVFHKENVGFSLPWGVPRWTLLGVRLGGVLGGSWEAFWGGSWGVLGASWGRFGAYEGVVLGASWVVLRLVVLGATWGGLVGVLGASWGRFGVSWGRPGGVLGSFWGVEGVSGEGLWRGLGLGLGIGKPMVHVVSPPPARGF